MLYDYLFYFFIYAFLGWCAEVAFHTLTCGDFSNRGFLYGPVCPIYGFGAVLVLSATSPFAKNTLLLFVVSMLLTTFLELVTGFVLDKIFHNKWWDYSMYPFNIGGYICPLFSIIWGAACVFLIKFVHPVLALPVKYMPRILGIVLLSVFTALFLTDAVLTVLSILRFNNHLRVLAKVSSDLRQLSDGLGIRINDNVLGLMDKTLSAQIELAEHREKFEALVEKYQSEIDKFKFSDKHLLAAFPDMKSRIHDLAAVRRRILKKGKRRGK